MEIKDVKGKLHYCRYTRDGFRYLVRCHIEKARWDGKKYSPVDEKHVWLQENMKRNPQWTPKRYVFYDIKYRYANQRCGVMFRTQEDVLAFVLRWR